MILFEKLILNEGPEEKFHIWTKEIDELVNRQQWDAALQKLLNGFKDKKLRLTFKKPLDSNVLDSLKQECEKAKIEIEGYNVRGETVEDLSSAVIFLFDGDNIVDVIDNLDGGYQELEEEPSDWDNNYKNYYKRVDNQFVKLKDPAEFEEHKFYKQNKKNALPKNREESIQQLNTDETIEALIDQFAKDPKRMGTPNIDDDAKPIFYKIFKELGLNRTDNPFIDFFQQTRDWLHIDNQIITGLHNLYANNIIDDTWLDNRKNAKNDILFNRFLYQDHAKDLEDVVKFYDSFSNNSEEDIKKRDNIFFYQGNSKNKLLNLDNIKNKADKDDYIDVSKKPTTIKLFDQNIDDIDLSKLTINSIKKLQNKLAEREKNINKT